MPSFVEFFNRKRRAITRIVDETFFRLLEPTAPIERLYPRTNYVERELLLLKFKGHRPTVASVVAEEQEIPSSRPQLGMNEEDLSNCKVGKRLTWKAKDFEMLRKMQMLFQGTGQSQQAAAAIQKHYFGQIADLVPAVNDKGLMLTLMVAATGKCDFIDPLTEARFLLEYDVPASLLPAPLTGNARWSQGTQAACVPLDNFEALARAHYDINGSWAPNVTMHWHNLRQVADANSTKIAKLRKSGADTTNPDVTGLYINDDEAMDMIKERTRATEVIIFDAQLSEEQKNGTIVDKYFLPDDYVVLSTPGTVEQAFVPTVERDFQSGLYTNTKQVNDAPRVESSVAVGNFIPAVFDRRKICARKVN